tara:strand:+ start:740 stop:1858 length:1119 start_codon:yes stop_codon:yes gene_type:complete
MTKAAELAKMGEVLTNSQIGGRRNIIINGAMQVAQRGTSASSASGYLTCDRFQYNLVGTVGASTVTQNTVTDLPGFTKSLKVDVTTADASLAVGDRLTLRYAIEGQDVQQVAKGTSSAEQLTLSFYIKATKTGTQIVELFDHDNTRHCAKSVTINSSNTWEKKTITYPADTTGAFDNDNAISLSIFFGLAVGTNFTSGTLATAWASNTLANRFAGQVNHFDSTDNNFEITGVQLEVGEQATPFEHRSFGEELALCQRYYSREEAATGAAYKRYLIGSWSSTTGFEGLIPLSTPLRTTPTLETTGTAANYAVYSADSVDACTSLVITNDADAGTDNRAVAINVTTSSGGVAGEAGTLLGNNDTDNFLALDAEL